jgi:hypothetical protein
LGSWTAKEIHEAVLTIFGRLEEARPPHELRKLKGRDLLTHDGSPNASLRIIGGLRTPL